MNIQVVCKVNDITEIEHRDRESSYRVLFEVILGPLKGEIFDRRYVLNGPSMRNLLRAIHPESTGIDVRELIGRHLTIDLEPRNYRPVNNFEVFKTANKQHKDKRYV